MQDIPLHSKHPSYATLVDVEEGLGKFRATQMLFIWGERDWCFTTNFLREFQRRFPRAETLSLSDAGHYVFEDAHETIIPRVREFLQKQSLS